jgi:hypothetical protein
VSSAIDELAEQLYDASPARSYHPAWHQLGETTKNIWRARALALSEFA